MSRLHAVALGAALLLGVSGIAGAQGQTQGKTLGEAQGQRGGHEGRRGRDFGARMAKDLNLTDAQKSQIKAIHEKYRSQFESIRGQVRSQNGATPRVVPQKGDSARRGGFRNVSPELRQRMLAVRTQELAEIRNVLTAQQRVKFDAAQA
ncbi:MAG: Spy/CpxP family protein refolding chaperone, partial [Gemmatimonadales bacterium]